MRGLTIVSTLDHPLTLLPSCLHYRVSVYPHVGTNNLSTYRLQIG